MHSTKETFTVKKDPTGESGSAKSMPLPDPGICHSDPAGAYFMTYTKEQKLHYIKIAVESINMRICELAVFMEKEDDQSMEKMEELKEAALYLIDVERKINT